jgi:hypothetical protein
MITSRERNYKKYDDNGEFVGMHHPYLQELYHDNAIHL